MENSVDLKESRRIYAGIDIAKFIFSILIVCLHLNMGNRYFLQGICRIATPMFFCISGFFSSKKMSDKSQTSDIKQTVFRLTKSYIFYSILYIPIALKTGWYSLDIIAVIKAIVYRGTFIQLWFYPALIESVIIIFILYRFLKHDWLVGIIPIVFYVYAISSFEYKWFPVLTNDINNVLFHGMFYFWLGTILWNRKISSIKIIKTGVLISFILFFLEISYLLKYNTKMTACFSLIAVVIFLMLYLINCPLQLSEVWSLRFRNMSMVIFGTHYIFYFVTAWYGGNIADWYIKVFILLMCTIFSMIIVAASRRWKILQIFY